MTSTSTALRANWDATTGPEARIAAYPYQAQAVDGLLARRHATLRYTGVGMGATVTALGAAAIAARELGIPGVAYITRNLAAVGVARRELANYGMQCHVYSTQKLARLDPDLEPPRPAVVVLDLHQRADRASRTLANGVRIARDIADHATFAVEVQFTPLAAIPGLDALWIDAYLAPGERTYRFGITDLTA